MKTVYVPLYLPHSWVLNNENIYSEKLSSDNDVSSHIMYQLKLVAMDKWDSTIDINRELMMNIAANQNSDGSMGSDDEILATSYFVLTMVLYGQENIPYKKQIRKAVSYLLNSRFEGWEVYLPLKLAYESNIYTEQDIIDRIRQIEEVDIQGNLKYLLNILKADTEEFSQICLGKALDKKELIKYLYDKLHY